MNRPIRHYVTRHRWGLAIQCADCGIFSQTDQITLDLERVDMLWRAHLRRYHSAASEVATAPGTYCLDCDFYEPLSVHPIRHHQHRPPQELLKESA